MNERFALALERLQAADWSRFEKLCSEFLASEWPKLVTVASPSGDEGRDAELQSPTGESTVLIQYSVTDNWRKKIRDTATKISSNFPDASLVVYMSNQEIGALADELRKELRTKYRLVLDVRDKNWFLERESFDPHRQDIAEKLAEQIADPYLVSRSLVRSKVQALSNVEARTAVIYLGLQWEDDTREKGLTKTCFEALVRAALQEATPERRMTLDQIRASVRAFMPTHDAAQVDGYTDSAVARLRKKALNYWAPDEYCLDFDERKKISEELARIEAADKTFVAAVQNYIDRYKDVIGSEEVEGNLLARVRRVLEKVLLETGEFFAASVVKGTILAAPGQDLRSLILRDAATFPVEKAKIRTIELTERVIADILASPSEQICYGLRMLADAYTLMAFLRETPDVQGAVVKMFAQGDIWLDANVVLPLLTSNLEVLATQKFIRMIRAAREAGLRLHVTPGVVQEAERHVNMCMAYSRQRATWQGRVPFLFAAYALSGRPIASFSWWVRDLCGEMRPEDDIALFLAEEFDVDIQPLEKETAGAEPDLRYSAEKEWYNIHNGRRVGGGRDLDENTMLRLVQHDVENMVGIIARRTTEHNPSFFGHTNWLLTLDRSAPIVYAKLRAEHPDLVKASPLLSADFLLNYLAFGPVRRQISKNTEGALPVLLDHGMFPFVPRELIEVAERVRDQNANRSETTVRRMVRDELDRARVRLGPVGMGGLDDVEREFHSNPAPKPTS